MRTRLATPADDGFLRHLFFVVRRPEFELAGMSDEHLEALLTQQYEAMRSYYRQEFPETAYTILEVEGIPIGYEALRERNELHLIDIALEPDYRNRGIGTKRVERLKEQGSRSGKSVLLSVEVFNPAQRLYERLGFVVEDEQGIYRRMRWTPCAN